MPNVGLQEALRKMANEEADQNLIRVKADATGVDVSVGRGLPDLIGRLLPSKFHIRRSVNVAITERLLEKIRSNADFDEAELAFAEDMVSDQARKYVRLKHVQRRAYGLFEETPPVRLIDAGDGPESQTSQTSDDWVNKFREDAGLVDDELIREIYARVLKEEAQRPSAFSLRTLGVLRYLDRDAATAFGRLQKVLIDGNCVPQQSQVKDHILVLFGLDHSTMLMLDDAGLINAASPSEIMKEGEIVIFALSGHGRVFAARRYDRQPLTVKLRVHLLTPAGQQLARIAESEPDDAAFKALTSWFEPHIAGAELLVANLPSHNWTGQFEDLAWQRVDSVSDSTPTSADASTGSQM